jgi:hypothetical protein
MFRQTGILMAAALWGLAMILFGAAFLLAVTAFTGDMETRGSRLALELAAEIALAAVAALSAATVIQLLREIADEVEKLGRR